MQIIPQFDHIHAWRDPDLIHRKRAKMAGDPVAFFRWSAILFYQALNQTAIASPYWRVCGDLHVENFGTFRGLDGEIVFDINDFDEATRWPIHRDLTRLMTSIAVVYRASWAKAWVMSELLHYTQERYITMMLEGKVWNLYEMDDDTPVTQHINNKLNHNQKDFINKIVSEGKIIRSDEFTRVLPSRYHEIEQVLEEVLHHFRGTKICDITRHVMGNASLWLDRYAVLIQWNKKDHYHILDLKQAVPSVLWNSPEHIHWSDQAQRIISIQKIMQWDSPFILSTLIIGEESFIIKEMQAAEDKISFDPKHKHTINHKLIDEMVHALVCAQLSAADVLAAVSLPQLMEYVQSLSSDTSLIDFAMSYADLNDRYHQQFVSELTSG